MRNRVCLRWHFIVLIVSSTHSLDHNPHYHKTQPDAHRQIKISVSVSTGSKHSWTHTLEHACLLRNVTNTHDPRNPSAPPRRHNAAKAPRGGANGCGPARHGREPAAPPGCSPCTWCVRFYNVQWLHGSQLQRKLRNLNFSFLNALCTVSRAPLNSTYMHLPLFT